MPNIRQLIHPTGTVVFAVAQSASAILEDVLSDASAKCLGTDPEWLHLVLSRDGRRHVEAAFGDLIETVPNTYPEPLMVTHDLPVEIERQIVQEIANALLATFRPQGYDADRSATRH